MEVLLIICPLVFLAGIIDAVAGGGGIISLPAYIFAGIPIHIAYGTNKFASCIGTSISSIKFFRSGNIKIKSALLSAAGALIGSWFGAQIVLLLNEKYLNYCLIIILPIVSLFLLFNRSFGVKNKKELSNKKLYILSFIIGLFLGAYDGFFGPGTGTFLVICFTGILGFNLITASGNAKIVNLASNFSALIAYILGGKVMFSIGVPAAVCAIAGNYLGAHLAIKNGDKIIKPIIFVAIGLLFIKVIFDLI
ncbi:MULTISPECIES: TSUP family transporter [unclassified Clostridium]|uniref:TSUP family transporter n=1 Tax=unclassified Clostridium TaxID=2614128 RepID=UPI0002F0C0EB|nr:MULTISPECIES: TSUP family transporter [unclassified Clostridium]MBN1046879.1 sulfite exporter TauE/SafE family protein [Clostridium botulinum]MBN1053572.1 sulfite exporter TauE/SafE family protein [Clostridium botulinum]MBN1056777.1 sulfite exporter TauE/SafE family protein [Clostridium botulinum]NFN95571.1 sulfite exporter TauE/SafE family protein [Clostridium botulinum]NFR87671.1 sulfite exporter TauE/SafE family protein [Clostridium botulinum]